jgi:hypothetical protein
MSRRSTRSGGLPGLIGAPRLGGHDVVFTRAPGDDDAPG